MSANLSPQIRLQTNIPFRHDALRSSLSSTFCCCFRKDSRKTKPGGNRGKERGAPLPITTLLLLEPEQARVETGERVSPQIDPQGDLPSELSGRRSMVVNDLAVCGLSKAERYSSSLVWSSMGFKCQSFLAKRLARQLGLVTQQSP